MPRMNELCQKSLQYLAALLALCFVGRVSDVAGSNAPIALTVTPSATEYDLSDRVTLHFRLDNVSATPATVSAFLTGTACVKSIQRDGVPVRPKRVIPSFL